MENSDINRRCESGQAFRFMDGAVAYSVAELAGMLSVARYEYHAGSGRNDFVAWVRGVFHDEVLAEKIAAARSPEELSLVIRPPARSPVHQWISVPMSKGSLSIPSLHTESPSLADMHHHRELSLKHEEITKSQSLVPLSPNVSAVESHPDEMKRMVKKVIHDDPTPSPSSQPSSSSLTRKDVLFWGLWDFALGILVGFAIGYFTLKFLF